MLGLGVYTAVYWTGSLKGILKEYKLYVSLGFLCAITLTYLWKEGVFSASCANLLCTYWMFLFAVTDIKDKIIPNKLVLISFFVALLVFVPNFEIDFVVTRLIGAVFAFVVTTVASFVSKGGIGMGDAKLMAVVGIFVGLTELTEIFFWALIFAILYGLGFVFLKKVTNKTAFAFAPFVFLALLVHLAI